MTRTHPLFEDTHESPLGVLRLQASGDALTGLYFPDHRHPPRQRGVLCPTHPVLQRTRAQLDEFFRGARTDFDLPTQLIGSGFQLEVWRGLRTIPFGETLGYGELAARIGRPGAARAVGAANGKNPLSIVVPCHRVIAGSGRLTGYAGGLEAKRWLLEHERKRS